jgi:hypothetical protein
MKDAPSLLTKPTTLTEWVAFFDAFFERPNRGEWTKGYRGLGDFTDRLSELGGYITSSKHQSSERFRKYYAKYFAWYCGLVAQARLDVETAVWTKFPGKCPYCNLELCAFVYNPGLRVHRISDRFEVKRDAETALRGDPSLAARSLSGWFSHFISIYPINLHRSLGDIAERFHEEQSELIKAVREAHGLRQERDGSLKDSPARTVILEELSDLLSWYLTLGAKVLIEQRGQPTGYQEFISREQNGRIAVDFDELIFSFYRQGCTDCGQKPCECSRYVSADRSDLKEELVMVLPNQVTGTDEIVNWLRSTEELDLTTVRVVGRFVAGTAEARDHMKRIVDDLRTRVNALSKPYCVLVCGASGAGKSFFVDEFVTDLGLDKRNYLTKNFSAATDLATELSDLFLKITVAPSPRVAFVDEVDTVIKGESSYRFLLTAMKGEKVPFTATHQQALPGVLMFFAASAAPNLPEFRRHLEVQKVLKAEDFLRRFEEAGVVIEFPSKLTPQDKVMQVLANAFAVKSDLEEVEARVLLYFATLEWPNTGALKGSVHKAMERVTGRIFTLGAIGDHPNFVEFMKSGISDTLGARLIRVWPVAAKTK